MTVLSNHHQADEPLVDEVAGEIERVGLCVIESALPPALTRALYNDVSALGQSDFQPAGIGRESEFRVDAQVRTDCIRWLSGEHEPAAAYLNWAQDLRQGLNQRLFLGLFDYEAHYACYGPGAFYRLHTDTFRGRSNRLLSTVVYLNENWSPQDGGALLIYDGKVRSSRPIAQVLPTLGTLVVFLSERFPHEVQISRRQRFSIAGWFSPRALHASGP